MSPSDQESDVVQHRTNRIMVVDDDPYVLKLIEKYLLVEQYELRCFTAGKAALEEIGRNPPDLLLLDYRLKDLTGHQFIESLQDLGIQLPFIIISGQGDEKTAVEMMKLGALDYLVKDTGFFELLPLVVRQGVKRLLGQKMLAKTEQDLRESEARYRSLFENAGVSIFLIHPGTEKILTANRTALELLGYQQREVTDLHARDVFESPISPSSNDESYVYETDLLHKDGQHIAVEVNTRNIHLEKEEVLQTFCRDITNRKIYERRIELNNKVLYTLNSILSLSLQEDGLSQRLEKTLDLIHSLEELHFSGQGMIYLGSDSPESLTLVAHRGIAPGQLDGYSQTLKNSAFCRRTLKGKKACFILGGPDCEDLPRTASSPCSFFGVPIRSQEGVLGLLVLNLTQGYDRNEETEGFLHAVADTLAGFIERNFYEERIRQLSAELLRSQEQERQRVARELHDGVGQTLLAAKLNFSAYERDPDRYAESFQKGMEIIDMAAQELRAIYSELYPTILQHLGLLPAIQWHARNHLEAFKIRVSFDMQLNQKPSPEQSINLYRIVQEAFANIVKHSRARQVTVSLHLREDAGNETAERLPFFEMVIRDDGIGFRPGIRVLNPENAGCGLENMAFRARELGGKLFIESTPEGGTTVTARIPLTAPCTLNEKSSENNSVAVNQ